jgi:hypothetical protein
MRLFSLHLIKLPLIGLALALGLSSCSPALVPYATPTPDPTPTQMVFTIPLPVGRYDCLARENGLLVGTGSFTFLDNGQVLDEMTGATGTWAFNPATGRLVFSDSLDIREGTYDTQTGLLTLFLRPGVVRTHAVGDLLACEMIMR